MAVLKRKKKQDDITAAPYTKATFVTQIIMTILAILFLSPLAIILNYSFKTKRELLGRATYSRNPIIIVQVWQRIRKSGTYNTLPNRIRI